MRRKKNKQMEGQMSIFDMFSSVMGVSQSLCKPSN